MLTWYDLKQVLPGVIQVRREVVNFTETQLDDSLQTKKHEHKTQRANAC